MNTVSIETKDDVIVYRVNEEKTKELIDWLEKNSEIETSDLFDDLIIDIEVGEKKALKAEVKKEGYEDRPKTHRPKQVGRGRRKSSDSGLQEREKKERQ